MNGERDGEELLSFNVDEYGSTGSNNELEEDNEGEGRQSVGKSVGSS